MTVPQGQEIIYIDDAERNRKAGEAMGWRTFASIDECVFELLNDYK